MGLFWDLMQQSELSSQKQRSDSLENRVSTLEIELAKTNRRLYETLKILEVHVRADVDGDGKVG
jgi:hypothetical protein